MAVTVVLARMPASTVRKTFIGEISPFLDVESSFQS
jgi:hypothetical protein